MVPKSEHSPSQSLDPRGALFISLVFRVLSAISFDDEAMLSTSEIDDEMSDWMLATEFVSGKPTITHCEPKPAFRVGH